MCGIRASDTMLNLNAISFGEGVIMDNETTGVQQTFNDRSNGRDSFVFYRSFKESLNDLSDKDKLIVYEAISDYALDKQEPNLEGFPRVLFKLITQMFESRQQVQKGGCNG